MLDIRDAVYGADLVLAPSCSPQCVAALKSAYPTARIVVVELEDWDFKVNLPGPVKRVLNAGADAYLLADSLDQLAQQLRPRPKDSDHQDAEVYELVQSSTDDEILASIQDILERRETEAASATGNQRAPAPGRPPVTPAASSARPRKGTAGGGNSPPQGGRFL
ncbi:MAG TPA: hypothetical protein VMF65_10815 [Acidimicrobiales bacterium]|nr:hypothetical protein [Acidimicrobiales bacterium]